jgi:soluble lytic murein transglycosylase-like protein
MPCAARFLTVTLAFAIALAPSAPSLAHPSAAVRFDNTYAHAVRAINPRLAQQQCQDYASALLVNSQRMHLDPRLVMAVVTVESGWNARAVSPDGALGLGQFKPETARDLGIEVFSGRSNLRGVTLYLHQLLGMFRSSRDAMREAIASYNAGPYTVKAYGGVPRGEPRRYVTKVLSLWHSFKARLSPRPTVLAVATALDDAQLFQRDEASYWGVR